jgi:hypothetical protein
MARWCEMTFLPFLFCLCSALLTGCERVVVDGHGPSWCPGSTTAASSMLQLAQIGLGSMFCLLASAVDRRGEKERIIKKRGPRRQAAFHVSIGTHEPYSYLWLWSRLGERSPSRGAPNLRRRKAPPLSVPLS